MALTVEIEGKGVIANCDQLTNDTGGSGTGDWSEQGGGTMTLSPDVYLVGSGSIGGKYASKSGVQQFDLGTGNELDFDTAGTEEGQFIYMWVNMAAFASLDTLANTGLAIRISSSSPATSNYKDYTIAGQDGANGWTGGWKLFVIDPTKTASRSSGTCDIGSIRTLGVWIDTASSVRAESLWIDQIAVGSGLRITGSHDSGSYDGAWEEAVAYCTDYTNRGWGMLQERDGVYYAFGKIYIGSDTQTAVTDFTDSNRVIQFGTSQYYESSAWKTSFDVDGAGIIVDDDTVYKTDFTDGVIVGTENGRSGCTYIGNEDQDVFLDLYGGNITTSRSYLYGTILQKTHGVIQIGASHRMYGATVNDIGQIDPIGIAEIENVTVIGSSADSALLITASNEMSIIKIDSFIDNITGTTGSAGHSIELTATGSHAFVDISFSGGGGTQGSNLTPASGSTTADVFNDSGGLITINVTGGDTPSVRNGAGATTIVVNAVTIKFTVKDAIGDFIENANILVEADTGGSLPADDIVTITRVTTTATVAHTAHGLSNGDKVIIREAVQDEYNGLQTISNVSTNAYDYTVSGTPTTPATGTIEATAWIMDGLTSALGVLQITDFNYGSNQPIRGRVRKSS